MKLKEVENYLNNFTKYNFKIEMKREIYEYTIKCTNPELQTINSRHRFIEIPIFI